MPSLAVEGVENAGHPTTAFPTPPTATAATTIENHPQILRRRPKKRIATAARNRRPMSSLIVGGKDTRAEILWRGATKEGRVCPSNE